MAFEAELGYYEASRRFHPEIRVTFVDPGVSETFVEELPRARVMKSHLLAEFLQDDSTIHFFKYFQLWD
jgi:hypothetical protein